MDDMKDQKMETAAPRREKRRKLKTACCVIIVVLAAVLGVAGNFLFDFALNPNGIYTMKMMQDSQAQQAKAAGHGEKQDAEERKARAWFKRRRVSCSMNADDGTKLYGWVFAQNGQRGVTADMNDDGVSTGLSAISGDEPHDYAICLHGYTNEPIGMARYAKRFFDRGMTVLTPAARAHERSGGEYIGMGWPERNDVVKWAREIVRRDPQARILIFGVSMGGATAMDVAGEKLPCQVRCIIEDCGYTSVWDEFSLQLKDVFGLPSFPLLDVANATCNVRAGYDFRTASSVEQLKKATLPMLFIHGDKDTFVPYSMLDQNYDACASKIKQKLTVHGATHAKSAQVDPELYWSTVENFLEANFDA